MQHTALPRSLDMQPSPHLSGLRDGSGGILRPLQAAARRGQLIIVLRLGIRQTFQLLQSACQLIRLPAISLLLATEQVLSLHVLSA